MGKLKPSLHELVREKNQVKKNSSFSFVYHAFVPTTTIQLAASIFETVPGAPADVIFALTAAYKADTDPKKVNLGVGAYRTEEGKPWVLPVVKKVKKKPIDDSLVIHGYQRKATSPRRNTDR